MSSINYNLKKLSSFLEKKDLLEELDSLLNLQKYESFDLEIDLLIKESFLTKKSEEKFDRKKLLSDDINESQLSDQEFFERRRLLELKEKGELTEQSLEASFLEGQVEGVMKGGSFCDSLSYTVGSTVLTFVGLIPAIGVPVDVANGLLNLYCGDYLYALLSFISAIPLYGYIGNALKVIFAGAKGLRSIPKIATIIANWWKGTKSAQKMTKAGDDVASAQRALDALGAFSHTVPPAQMAKAQKKLEKAQKYQRSLQDAQLKYTNAKRAVREDYTAFTTSTTQLITDSGKYSKFFGVNNASIRNFLKWKKDIFYVIEEQLFGLDKQYSNPTQKEIRERLDIDIDAADGRGIAMDALFGSEKK